VHADSFCFSDPRLYEEELRRKAALEQPLPSGGLSQRPLSDAGPIESGKSRSIDLLKSGGGGGLEGEEGLERRNPGHGLGGGGGGDQHIDPDR
jgi:hypothetical protein